MSDAVLLLAGFVCVFVGMAWLALAMDVHWRQVCGARALSRRGSVLLRLLAVAALALSAVFCLLADSIAMAVLVWVMALTASSVAVAMLLSFRPRVLAPLAASRRPAAGRAGRGATATAE